MLKLNLLCSLVCALSVCAVYHGLSGLTSSGADRNFMLYYNKPLRQDIYAMNGMQKMQRVIFREYDIRGEVGSDVLIDQMYDLGRAIAYFFKQKRPEIKTVALGMDGRTHSPLIKKEIERACLDSGLNVVFVGLCSSPALYFSLYTKPYDAGIMITASHNPKEYNGIKLCLGKASIYGHDVQEIYELYAAGAHIKGATPGSYQEEMIIPSYVDWLADHFAHLKNMPLKAVVDCGNGAGATVLPLLVEKMGWQEVQLLYATVDGNYPNHEADPTKLENMQDVKTLLHNSDAAVGVGLDGDADRMAAMTKEGILVPGDLLLGLFARQIAGQSAQRAVVFDIKSSKALADMLQSVDMVPVMAPSGHAIVKNKMRETDAVLGGELSCHFFFNDTYFGFDDGVYAMLRLFDLLLKEQRSLDELLAMYPVLHSSIEYRIACPEHKKQLIVQTVKDLFLQKEGAEVITIDGVRVTTPYGWALLRASNTQPMLSMRFEAESKEGLERMKEEMVAALALFYAPQELRDQLQD